MFAINKSGQVFVVSFTHGLIHDEVKTLKPSKVHAKRYGWGNECLFVGGRHSDDPCCELAKFLIVTDEFSHPIGTMTEDGILRPCSNSGREYKALERA